MSVGGYHFTREITCSQNLAFKQNSTYVSIENCAKLVDLLSVPNLNMSPVNIEKINKLCGKIGISEIFTSDFFLNSTALIAGTDNLDLSQKIDPMQSKHLSVGHALQKT